MTVFDDDLYFTGAKCSQDMLAHAEVELGYKLPDAYKKLLLVKNGGSLINECFRTSWATSWADDHFEVSAIYGVGDYSWGLDSESGSKYMIDEWELPKIGVLFCATTSGHDFVMLDYRNCKYQDEPEVAYIDEDRRIRKVSNSFEHFISNLEPSTNFE